MTEKLCRTCMHWGPQFAWLDHAWPYYATAECNHPLGGSDALNLSLTHECHYCDKWQQREGEPLGTGLSKFWWHPELFRSASIIHDLRYDVLKPGGSTAEIDREWHSNALLLAGSSARMRRLADIGYAMIRLYGIGRKSLTKQ